MDNDFVANLHADPWVQRLLDLPELNHAASALVERRLTRVRTQAAASPASLKSSSVVLLGPPGTGKTHLFSRLRKRLGPRASFVHLRPLLHAGITPSFVLREAVNQLANASYGRKESQADALVGSLIGQLDGQSSAFPEAHLSTFRDLGDPERNLRLDALADRLLELFPDLDDVFLERLLQVPFVPPRTRRALLAWLSGQDCDPSQLGRIGASSSMGPDGTLRALKTLSSVAALGSPLVLVFDQLENLVQKDGIEARITQYGHLIAELVDCTRGLLVVQMALESEWHQGILPHFNLSQRSRVVMESAVMDLPNPDQGRALLELWCREIVDPEGPFPWPLSAEQVDRLTGLVGVTPRVLLSALKEASEGNTPSMLEEKSPPLPEGSKNAGDVAELWDLLSEEWQARLVAAHLEIDRAESRRAALDVNRLCDGILLTSSFVPGAELQGTSDPYIQMDSKEKEGKWVCCLHQAHHSSIGAAFERVLGRDSTEPGVVIREQWRSFPPSWKSTQDKLVETIARPHLRFVELTRAEAACLLALEETFQFVRSRDLCDVRGVPLEEGQVRDFIRQIIRPERWNVALALMPEGELEDQTITTVHAAVEDVDSNGHADADASDVSTNFCPGLDVILDRLQVASVDRVIREVRRADPSQGRASVLLGLERMGTRVKWFGRNIVSRGGES